MKRTCFFNTTPFWGGGEKWHLKAARALRARGRHVVVVGHPESPLTSRARDAGIETAEFALVNRSWLHPLKRRRLIRFFRDRAIETVIFNGPADIKAGGLAARAAGVRQRVYRRGLALPIGDRWFNRYLLTKVLTHVIPNSEETQRVLFEDIGDVVPEERMRVITNGIDLPEFDAHPYAPVFSRDGRVVLGNVGRLTVQKNQRFLLHVARSLVDQDVSFRLLIAGSGELEPELREEARRLRLEDHVEFLGFVGDVPSFLRDIDIFVLTSLWEGFSNVILEAAAVSRPTVALDISSNPEGIVEGTTGFLVEPGNVEQFAARLRRLIEDEDLRARMGDAARADVVERFRFDRKIDELEAFLWG
jgi:glycosyltransferase involved in cell wall biosynthesis